MVDLMHVGTVKRSLLKSSPSHSLISVRTSQYGLLLEVHSAIHSSHAPGDLATVGLAVLHFCISSWTSLNGL